MKYYKQLDSIRAFAVFFVIMAHWLPAQGNFSTSIIDLLSGLGVNTFFVLSGFLISGILLKSRVDAEAFGLSKSHQLKAFYIRRVLRIFPIYYLTLLFLFLFRHKLAIPDTEMLYGATYTLNIYFIKINSWTNYTAHFWTLAVEEQFYLIWPWLMIYVEKKFLVHAIVLFIITGILTQHFMQYVGISMDYALLLTPTCFDSFGLGALLAWIVRERRDLLNRFYTVTTILMLLSLSTFLPPFFDLKLMSNFSRTFQSIVGLWVITSIIRHNEQGGFFYNQLLSFRPLMFLGRISYGLYVYHVILNKLMIGRLQALLDRILPPVLHKHQPYFVFWIMLALLVVISWLSWICFERPILQLKRHFRYSDLRPA